MPKVKVAFPLDKITGTIWGPDRTIGRDVGFASSIREIKPSKNPSKSAGYKTQLYATTAPTRGGSTARHERAESYCACDTRFKALGALKQSFLVPWYKAASGNRSTSMTDYNTFLKICLLGLIERDVFERFEYWSRYRVWNQSDATWINRDVILDTIPTRDEGGTDLEVYSLFATATTVGPKTYTARMIDSRLTAVITVESEALVTIPFLQSQTSMLVDVYSFRRE